MSDDKPKLDNDTQFKRVLGSTISAWNMVEDGLGDVFCALFGSINHLAARNAYLAVINFNARMNMVEASAAAALLSDDLLSECKTLLGRAGKKSGIRNKLTHFSRVNHKLPSGERAICLVPNFWTGDEWAKSMEGRGHAWTWPEVAEFGNQFSTLAIKLTQLARKIEEHRQKQPLKFPQSTFAQPRA